MIQRIQSIFLFLASASFFTLFGIPLASSAEEMAGIFADQTYNVFDNPILIVVTIIGGILALGAIFLFRNRPLQKKIGYGIIAFALIFIAVAVFLFYQDSNSGQLASLSENFGIGLPILAIVFTLFANRYISKDDKLVKSMDRLR